MSRWWVLGARDPEMDAIENLLKGAAEPFFYAVHSDGTRVTPGTAYMADDILPPNGGVTSDAVGRAVLVECAVPSWTALNAAAVCDHHYPGQPGYEAGPEDFLRGSSIGQVISLLARDRATLPFKRREWFDPGVGFTPGALEQNEIGVWGVSGVADVDSSEMCAAYWAIIPMDLVFTAALDHCPAAAYAGKCPGLAPQALREWWIDRRAYEQGLSRTAIRERISIALNEIAGAPRICVGPDTVVDCRDVAYVPELPEAAAFAGIPILTAPQAQGQRRLMLRHATPEAVEEFLRKPPEPLHQMFGVPARGYAGGQRS